MKPLTKKQAEGIVRTLQGATREDFTRIFGETESAHLWKKFQGYGRDIVLFVNSLDSDNYGRLYRLALELPEGE